MKRYYFKYRINGNEFEHWLKLDTWEEIKKEFGSLRKYLKQFIHERFTIVDHYITTL